jgi:hypothetical protein
MPFKCKLLQRKLSLLNSIIKKQSMIDKLVVWLIESWNIHAVKFLGVAVLTPDVVERALNLFLEAVSLNVWLITLSLYNLGKVCGV